MKFKAFLNESEDLSYFLGPISTLSAIGPEKSVKTSHPAIQKYVSPHGSVRYIYFLNNIPVSVLQLVTRDNVSASIANVYTLPDYRRQGYAKELLQVAGKDFSSIQHHHLPLTDLGQKWRDGVS